MVEHIRQRVPDGKIHEMANMISGMAYEMSLHNHTFFHFEQRVELYLKRELTKVDIKIDPPTLRIIGD